jgi:phosphoenolpyruvate carboxykinase (GTP)
MAGYFAHWLATGPRLARPPRIFRVNWFRKDDDGRFLWPGYSENVRILQWIVNRIHGRAEAAETPVGFVPTHPALDLDGLDVSPARLGQALRCDPDEWLGALDDLAVFYRQFGDRMPEPIWRAHGETIRRLGR